MKKILLRLLITATGVLFFLKGKDPYTGYLSSVSLSDGLNVASTMTYTLPDQFGTSHTLDDAIRTLILVLLKIQVTLSKRILGRKVLIISTPIIQRLLLTSARCQW